MGEAQVGRASAGGGRGRWSVGRAGTVGGVVALGMAGGLAAVPVSPTAAAPVVAHVGMATSLVWQQVLPDAGSPIGQGSPSVATLDGGGSSVVVGDRAGSLWAFHLNDGSGVKGWPAHTNGAPIDSTPSVTPDGSGTDTVFVGAGNAAQPRVGGYYAFNRSGAEIWGRNAQDPNGLYGVQASMAVGSLNEVNSVVAPSLGQDEYAFDASSGSVLPGWPFFTADSDFTTPALADLYGNGQTEVVEGGDSSPGLAYGQTYTAGGHLRVVGASGNLICSHDTNQTVDSSPAVGNFLAGGQVGIAFGTGSYYPGASDSNTVFGSDSHCNIVWRTNLGGNTMSSPAIGDLQGDGTVEVVAGADTGSGGMVWALNGATGGPMPGWPQSTSGRIIGGITTADLTGAGYNDVLVPTTDGLVIYDGRSAQVVATLGAGSIGLQNSPMVTIDPNGSIGITIAGYNAQNAGFIQHYEVAGSNGRSLGKRSWPMFHQNPQLTGWLSQSAPGHLNQPINGMALTGDGKGYWEVASDGGLFAFGDAGFHGSMGGQPLNRPVVGMATTPDGKGYWEVASDGGLFTFGDAGFYGSTGAITLNRPVVGMAATADGKGYWLVASDGGLFAFGDAGFFGSMGGQPLNRPIVGMAANGRLGYWLVASDGGIFAFGGAPFYGSTGGIDLVLPVVSLAPVPGGGGYWMAAADGGLFAFNAAFYGSIPQLFAAAVTGAD